MNDSFKNTLQSLKLSSFRSRFKLSKSDLLYIRNKGLDTIHQHAIDFVTDRIAPQNPRNDGKQTPMKNHPVFIAQHATATCCRCCIQKWHKISENKALDEKEIYYIANIIMAWIEEQLEQYYPE